MINYCENLRLAVIATVSFVVMLTGLCPAAVHAQSATAGENVVAPAGRVPFVTQATPVEPTPEQLQLREQSMARANRPGPPLSVEPGFFRRSPEMPPTEVAGATPRSLASFGPNSVTQFTAPQVPNAPGDMTYFLTHDQPAFSTGKSQINEPSVGTASSVVFVSSNWDAAYSANRGSTFTFVNPYTLFPSIDDGFCCDQTVIYAPSTGTMIWQLQYSYSAATQKNTYRIAFAPAANVAAAGWCYYDFNPQEFGQAAGTSFDYPDVSVSNSFVWFQARIFKETAPTGFVGTAIWRIPLNEASQCLGFTYNYFVTDSAHFTASLAKGATTTMFFFAHNSTSQERLYNWPENSGTISWNDINVTTWFDAARSCPGPDALNWCDRNNGSTIGRTTWVAGGVIGTMWGSSQGGGRPYPYIRVARFNESTKALINEPDIWTGSLAYIYPSVSVNDRGHLGGVLFYGGGSSYPTLATLIWDDLSAAPAPWEVYTVVASAAGATSWGDYTTTRRHGANGNTWVGTGQFKPSAGAVDTYYLWFGRQRDQPPTNDYLPNAFTATAGSTAFGSNVNASKEEGEPNHATNAGGKSVWWSWTAPATYQVSINTCGSSFDTLLGVYIGSSVTGLTPIAANDDSSCGLQSSVTFLASAGTTYRIAVDGFGGASGAVNLNINQPDSTPDAFSFTSQSGVALSTVATSNTIIPTGYTAVVAISVSGGSYSINGSPSFVTTAGTISPGQNVAVRQTSSGSPGTTTTATLTIGGVAGTFSVTTAAAPSAPTAVSVTAGSGSIVVHFGPPASNGGASITGYTATCTSTNGGVSGSNTGGPSATSIQVSGLTGGKTYTCTVTATNSAGVTGPATAPSSPVTPKLVDLTPILMLLLD